jgi:5'-3' exonuclease
MKVAIVDLASMFHKLWHVNRDEVEFKIVSFLKTLQYDKVIVAIDAPPYERKKVYPEYKANRDIPDPELIGMLKIVQEKVRKAGFELAYSEGWEADDVIATLVINGLSKEPNEVYVYGVDKDLLQCTDLIDPFTGSISTPESRFELSRDQIVDYLALVGDSSDNIKGVNGIGDVTAKKMLKTYGSYVNIINACTTTPEKFSEKTRNNLLENNTVTDSIELIKLNTELEIKYLPAIKEEIKEPETIEAEPVKAEVKNELKVYEPVEYKRSLEPVDLNQAFKVATYFDRSGMYARFKGPEQMLMTIMRGRELGLGAMASLELIDMIQGKPTMKAAGMLALCLQRKDVCEYIYCEDMSDIACKWVTKRVGTPKEQKRTFTINDAEKMGLTGKDNWRKQPSVMLQWRACSQLIRMVYPDLINGLYAIEEME